MEASAVENSDPIKETILPVIRQRPARAERFIAITIWTAVMQFISDIAGHARLRGYRLPRASAMVRVAALTIVACALAGYPVQAGRTHA
jgi:hypothetical protein